MCHFKHCFNAECYVSEGGRCTGDCFNIANAAAEEHLLCKVNTASFEGTRVPLTCYARRCVCSDVKIYKKKLFTEGFLG